MLHNIDMNGYHFIKKYLEQFSKFAFQEVASAVGQPTRHFLEMLLASRCTLFAQNSQVSNRLHHCRLWKSLFIECFPLTLTFTRSQSIPSAIVLLDLLVLLNRSNNFACVSLFAHLFICLFVTMYQLRVFLRVDSLVFSDFLHEVRELYMVKGNNRIFVESLFWPKFRQKGPRKQDVLHFFENVVIFPKNHAK